MDEKKTPWEDHLLERKTERSLKDLRRTAVAFANSVRPGHVAKILIGECDDGSVPGVTDADKMQRDIRLELEKIYPAIVWRQRPYKKKGKTCLRIEIEFSGDTPHFGDAAWIRRGNESVKASDEIFDKLITIRDSVARELLKWVGKKITLGWPSRTHGGDRVFTKHEFKVVDITPWYVSFEGEYDSKRSEPLKWLTLGWDGEGDRLLIYVNPGI